MASAYEPQQFAIVEPPCSTCTRTSENKRTSCPPRMQDGRLFTDYRPRCDVNLSAMWKNTPMSGSYDYRQQMIRNGDAILEKWRDEARRVAACGTCKNPFDSGTMLPEQDVFKCDKVQCVRIKNDPAGLGTGRAYGSDVAADAWQRKLLAERKRASDEAGKAANCCDCPAFNNNSGAYLLATSGLNATGTPANPDPRWAIPAGGKPTSSACARS